MMINLHNSLIDEKDGEKIKCVVDSRASYRGGRDGDLFVRLGYRMHRGFHVMNLTANRDPFQLKLIDSCTRRKQMVRD